MPQDSRRNCHTDESYHPDRFLSICKFNTQNNTTVINDNGLRIDGRSSSDSRPIFLETGFVTRSKGSSYIEIGNTKVICACYGPKQLQSKDTGLRKGVLSCELKYASFASAVHKTDQANMLEKEYSVLMVDALSPCIILDRFPKAQVDIFVTILEDGGSAFPAAITAASLALADAGIELYSLAIGASLQQHKEWALVDPTHEEENMVALLGECTGSLCIAYMPGLSQVSMVSQQGYITHQQLSQGMVTLIELCKDVSTLVRRCLVNSIQRKGQQESSVGD
ncbi:EXOSC6 [Bugula neritina]|uniref:EXOSC6 n=1 Tax=Bugula neritina TaxID=10212 RepID=A0A7J7KS47_BUGNE|nr:EXOSC6 [Bugula neritina]